MAPAGLASGASAAQPKAPVTRPMQSTAADTTRYTLMARCYRVRGVAAPRRPARSDQPVAASPVAAATRTAPAAFSASTSAGLKPNSPRTSSVC